MRFLVVAFIGLFILFQSAPICSAGDARRVIKPKPGVSATPIEIPKPKQGVSATPTGSPKPKPSVEATPIEIPKPKRDQKPRTVPGK